jgi:hypothetical protein
MTTLGEPSTASADQLAAALEVVRRDALRSGRTPRAVLSLIRLSNPPTQSERLLLAAVRLLRSPHAIMPHPCRTVGEWTQRYGGSTTSPQREREQPSSS